MDVLGMVAGPLSVLAEVSASGYLAL